jgi:hypothetical protein
VSEVPNRVIAWIEHERTCLWSDFAEACRRAVRPPLPAVQASWSIEMEWIADRIRSADELLGDTISWRNLGWTAWPYFPEISGEVVPDEAWEWLERHIETRGSGEVPIDPAFDTAVHVLAQRPT